MRSAALKLFKRFLALTTVVALTLFAVRAYDSQRGARLDVWHTYVPHELSAKELEAAEWSAYLDVDRQLGHAPAHVLEPILLIHGRAHRGAPTAPA